jgi:hypothetical protein
MLIQMLGAYCNPLEVNFEFDGQKKEYKDLKSIKKNHIHFQCVLLLKICLFFKIFSMKS